MYREAPGIGLIRNETEPSVKSIDAGCEKVGCAPEPLLLALQGVDS